MKILKMNLGKHLIKHNIYKHIVHSLHKLLMDWVIFIKRILYIEIYVQKH
jgi:hypothetical protein